MTTTSGNISGTSLVVQAYLNMTQDTTQGVMTHQSINIDCLKNTTACDKCIQTAKQYNMSSDNDYSLVCPSCFCNLENVSMSNYITLNMDAFTEDKSGKEFETQVSNALTQKTTMAGKQLFNTGGDEGLKALNKTSSKMYKEMSKIQFQTALQELKNFQVINIHDPATTLINVDMDLTVDFLSKLIQQSKSTSKILTEYDSTILTLTTKLIQGSMDVIITWIVTLFVITIIIIFFIFGIEIIMDVFMLYAVQ